MTRLEAATPVRIARGCWTDEAAASSLAGRCAAAVSSAGDFAVVAFETAGLLHRAWLPPVPELIHLATAAVDRPGRAMTRTRRPEFVGHRLQLRPSDITTVDGVPVTSPARTWRDLARVLTLPELVAAGDSLLRTGCTVDELAEQLGRAPGQPGVARAQRALALLDGRSASRPESHLRVAVSIPSLPRFAVNEHVYRAEGGWLAQPDLSLAEARLALEYQGADHADPARMRRDLVRAADLRSEGWIVLEYGPAQVFARPAQIGHEVLVLLRQRAPHLLQAVTRTRRGVR